MKKHVLVFVFLITLATGASAQNWTQVNILPNSVGLVTDMKAADQAVYVKDDIGRHYVITETTEELVSGSNVIAILGSVNIEQNNKQIYLESRTDGYYLMADSTTVSLHTPVVPDALFDFYRDEVGAKTYVAVGQTSPSSGDHELWVTIFDDSLNIIDIVVAPTNSSLPYKDIVIVDGENVVGTDSLGNIQHLNLSGGGSSMEHYNIGLSQIIDLAVDNYNQLVIVSENEGISRTQLQPNPSTTGNMYVVTDQYYPNFDFGHDVELQFKDQNCDGDLDAISYNATTGIFKFHLSLYTDNGSHNHITQILGTSSQKPIPITWVDYDGVNGWDAAIAYSDYVVVYLSPSGCSTVNLNEISMNDYTGPVQIFNSLGQKMYQGKQEGYMKITHKEGWPKGYYYIKATENVNVKTKTIPIFE